VVPLHAPLVVRSIWPCTVRPETTGSPVLLGAVRRPAEPPVGRRSVASNAPRRSARVAMVPPHSSLSLSRTRERARADGRREIPWAIEHGADAILLVDCVAPREIAASLAHGLPVVGCDTLDVGDAPMVAGIVGLMLSCNPALTPDEVRLILLETSGKAYDAV